MTRLQRRKLTNTVILGISTLAAVFGLVMLVWILGDVAMQGAGAIN